MTARLLLRLACHLSRLPVSLERAVECRFASAAAQNAARCIDRAHEPPQSGSASTSRCVPRRITSRASPFRGGIATRRASRSPAPIDRPAPRPHPQLHMPSELRRSIEEEEARESTRGYFSASPPRRSSSHSSPRAVVSPETGANRRYKFRRISASSDQEDEDGDDADHNTGDARRDEHDERHAGFAVSPSRLHSRRGGGGIGTPNQLLTRRSSGGSHASLVEEAARISQMGGGSGRWSRDGRERGGYASNGGDRHSAGSASPMSPAMPQRRRRFLS